MTSDDSKRPDIDGCVDNPKHDALTPCVVMNDDEQACQLKQFSSSLIVHCNGYNEVCDKVLEMLQNDELTDKHPGTAVGLHSDLKAMKLMFGMLKTLCEQTLKLPDPDFSYLSMLKQYFTQIVEVTREVWRKILACKDLHLALTQEFNDKGLTGVLQEMVAYVHNTKTTPSVDDQDEVTCGGLDDFTTSQSCELVNTLMDTIEGLEHFECCDEKKRETWGKLVISGFRMLKCIATIAGAAILGATVGLVLGIIGGPVGMTVGVGGGAIIGGSIAASHKVSMLHVDNGHSARSSHQTIFFPH